MRELELSKTYLHPLLDRSFTSATSKRVCICASDGRLDRAVQMHKSVPVPSEVSLPRIAPHEAIKALVE
jgi:hypothetical protein